MLSIVPWQLLLFPDARPHNWRPFPAGQVLRDKRSGQQWIKSVIAYCEFRAGEPWRRLSDPDQRNDPERWAYLDAARLIHSKQYESERPLLVAPPVLDPFEKDVRELSGWPREALVDVLLMIDPKLTSRRLLRRLTREKLARMIAEREWSPRLRRRA
jgi:hypothetical protein